MSIYLCSGNAKFDHVVEMTFMRSATLQFNQWFQHPLIDDPCLNHLLHWQLQNGTFVIF